MELELYQLTCSKSKHIKILSEIREHFLHCKHLCFFLVFFYCFGQFFSAKWTVCQQKTDLYNILALNHHYPFKAMVLEKHASSCFYWLICACISKSCQLTSVLFLDEFIHSIRYLRKPVMADVKFSKSARHTCVYLHMHYKRSFKKCIYTPFGNKNYCSYIKVN